MPYSSSNTPSSSPAFLLTRLLRDVSRSFYLTLRVLPGAIRPQIGLAYLLARATDTIADTTLVPVASRLQALDALRRRILGQSSERLNLGTLACEQGTPAERLLLERIEEALAVLAQFTTHDQAHIRRVLEVITSGQELDLTRFAGASAEQLFALPDEAALDDYTYRVAGCVGEFWTKLCRAHLFPRAPLDEAWLLRQGVRFGQGLQLVNILRDLPADLRQGRCYVPADALSARALRPADLLNAEAEPKFRPLYDVLLDKAHAHLEAGWAYTNALPRGSVRVRLACAWPILIGARTLALLRRRNVLDPRQRIKVGRAEVRRIIVQSLVRYPWRAAWQGLFERASRE